jgi:hypothetical protein
MVQIMQGVLNVDKTHMFTMEAAGGESYNATGPYSWGFPTLLPYTTLASYYPYFNVPYGMGQLAWSKSPALPYVNVENWYDSNSTTSSGSLYLRQESYWTYLTGATGYFYGNLNTWGFQNGWKNYLDSLGSIELGYAVKFFNKISWWKLVPDISNTFLTAGYGTFAPTNTMEAVSGGNYCTGAVSSDGTVGVVYIPAGGTVTINMAKFSGPVTAQWYDPTTYPNSNAGYNHA